MKEEGRSGYIGTWILVPELCLYEEGNPPVRGVYQIAQLDEGVRMSID